MKDNRFTYITGIKKSLFNYINKLYTVNYNNKGP